jgi:hypothetical protein
MAAAEIHGVPTQASCGAARLKEVRFTSEVHSVNLYADSDERGMSEARIARVTFKKMGLHSKILAPVGFKDWNDKLMEGKSDG